MNEKESPIREALKRYVDGLKSYRQGLIPETELQELKDAYNYVVRMYKLEPE